MSASGHSEMNSERDENYRLICAKRGTHWWVELRAGAWWAVGSPSADLDEAIQSVCDKFALEHPKYRLTVDSPSTDLRIDNRPLPEITTPASSTDLSDLFI